MRLQRLFRWIWRANALILLAAGLGGLALISVALLKITSDYFEPRRVRGVVNLNTNEVDTQSFRFGGFEPVTGSDYLSAPLHARQGFALGSVSKHSSSTRNYLFFDTTNQKAHWLLPDNKALVKSRMPFPKPSRYGEEEKPVVAVLWEVVERDTNGDAKLTETDLSSLYASGPSGKPLQPLVSDVQDLLGTHQTDADSAILMFMKNDTLNAASVDLKTLVVTSKREVSAQPKGATGTLPSSGQ